MPKRRRKPKRPPWLTYWFEVLSYEVEYLYSVTDPGKLTKRLVDRDYRGVRPEEPPTYESVDLELDAVLLEPELENISQSRVHLAASRQTPSRGQGCYAGSLTHGGSSTLTGWCWIPPTGLQALLMLLCSGMRVYVALDSEKLLWGGASVQHVHWYTAGHQRLREFFAEHAAASA